MLEYVADFETTTEKNDCRVWAWCICEIGNEDNLTFGVDIQSFLSFCETNGGIYHFHNLSFDGEFILSELFSQGYEYSEKRVSRTFKSLISNMGKFYQLDVTFSKEGKKKVKKAVCKDSLKKLPMSVDKVAKAFKLDIRKLDLDYTKARPKGWCITQAERDYIKNDVQIIAKALKQQHDKGLRKLTIGSDALGWYKDSIHEWATKFPEIHIEMDAEIRRAYRGGYTFVRPDRQSLDKDIIHGAGCVYDVNSLYPSRMRYELLPYGLPLYFKGQYEDDSQYPLFIQFLTCHCKLKKDHLPTLQIKNNRFFLDTQYITDTDGFVELALSNVDLELLFKHYDVTVMSYNGGYKFMGARGMFDTYIDYWIETKNQAKIEGNYGMYTISKLMLNSLYGKFATNPDVTPKIPYFEDGIVRYKLGEKEMRKPVYTAIGVFVTAYARKTTITAAQLNYDRFIYCDTDSLHLLGLEKPKDIEIDDIKLGAWAHENDFERAKFLRAKTYIEQIGGKLDIKAAGLPDDAKAQVTMENFKRGLVVGGKLRPCHVPGGIVLEETTFTVR